MNGLDDVGDSGFFAGGGGSTRSSFDESAGGLDKLDSPNGLIYHPVGGSPNGSSGYLAPQQLQYQQVEFYDTAATRIVDSYPAEFQFIPSFNPSMLAFEDDDDDLMRTTEVFEELEEEELVVVAAAVVKKPPGGGGASRRWTASEEEALLAVGPTASLVDWPALAAKLGRTPRAVRSHWHKLAKRGKEEPATPPQKKRNVTPPPSTPPTTPAAPRSALAAPPVGSLLQVHTYPENDTTKEPEWFEALVVRLHRPLPKKRKKDDEDVELELQYVEGGEIDQVRWPQDAADLRIIQLAPPPEPRSTKHRPKAPLGPVEANVEELEHMRMFFLCQLRAEHAECTRLEPKMEDGRCSDSRRAAYKEFDSRGSFEDVASCEPLMREFLTGNCARGDKWLPWHTVLGAHERYLLEVVRPMQGLRTERERVVASFAFSGSRHVPLFEALLRPLFEQVTQLGRGVIWQPEEAFKRGGELHRQYETFRKAGNKLHTTAYLCHPPRGSSGDEFTYYILDRTRRFVLLGHRVYDALEMWLAEDAAFNNGLLESRLDNSGTIAVEPEVHSAMESILLGVVDRCALSRGDRLRSLIEAELRQEYEIGPTMTKMFLVSTHLSYPDARVLEASCAVGDGAEAAFEYLYPRVPPRQRSEHRRELLTRLHQTLLPHQNHDDRLQRTLEWTAREAVLRFSPLIPQRTLGAEISLCDLQVNLCEWRKFRTKIDRKRLMRPGRILEPSQALAVVAEARRPSFAKRKPLASPTKMQQQLDQLQQQQQS